MNSTILVVDDEMDFLKSVRRALLIAGYKNITLVNDPRTVADLLQQEKLFDLAVIDITMPELNGMEVLSLIKSTSPSTECLMMTARDEARLAVECIKKGAYDYLVKPISAEDFIRIIGHAREKKHLLDLVALSKTPLRPKTALHRAFQPIITQSANMYSILREAELHARSEMPILISGATGTGKELLARAIHDASSRNTGPFSPINMASISENLFESAFFGHVKGAFTDAHRGHTGFLETTQGGTLFLDEIGTLPISLQSKLLRVLQEREFITLGTTTLRTADVRFVAATNADLPQLMADGLFRKDLYYRLRGAHLHLPPLRERKGDIPLLIKNFLTEFSTGTNSAKQPEVPDTVMALLMAYDYPGNVRELRAILQAAVNLSQGAALSPATLPADIAAQPSAQSTVLPPAHKRDASSLSIAEMEEELIRRTMQTTNSNLTHSAKRLGISLNTLRRKLDSYQIPRNGTVPKLHSSRTP